VIQLDDEQYWLYAAVDPESNDLLHTRLEPTRNNAIANRFSQNSATNTMLMTRSLSSMVRLHFSEPVANTASISDTNVMEIGTASNVSFVRVKRRTTSFSNCFSNAEAETANEWLRSFAFAWNQLI